MGNNQNQIIKQALEIVSENNRFAIKSITNNSEIKKNFYKLSGEPELSKEIEEDIQEMEKHKTDLEKRFHDLDLNDNPTPVDPTPKDETKNESEDESKDESEDEPKDKPRKPPKKTFYEKLRDWTSKNQINAIKELYGIDVTGLSQKEIAEMFELNYSPGPEMPTSRILNTNLGRDK